MSNITSSSRVTFRKAQLAAKRNLAESQRLERKLLLQSFSQPISQTSSPPPGAASDDGHRPPSVRPEVIRQRHAHQQQQQQTSSLTGEDQQTVGAAGNVTAALRRTHDIIAAELARSEFAHQTLTESSAALSKLDDSYGSLEGMLASSKDLLGTLVRSQKSDTWYLQTAMYMLMVTGAWLVYRRLLWGPMWWLVWLPLRLLYNVVMGGARGGSALVRRGGEVSSPGVVFEDGRVEVDGMPGEELPTIDVGGAGPSEGAEAPESLEEKIGRILDDVADGEFDDGTTKVEEQVDQGQGEEQVDQRQRDEL
jgi:protein transport protein SEC20